MSGFFRPTKDSSKENIEQVAKTLNKKPARQGSNQRLEDIVKPTEPKSRK